MPLGSSGSSLFYHLRVNRAELNWTGLSSIGQAASWLSTIGIELNQVGPQSDRGNNRIVAAIGQAAIGQAAIEQAA